MSISVASDFSFNRIVYGTNACSQVLKQRFFSPISTPYMMDVSDWE